MSSVFPDILYPHFFVVLKKMDFFNTHGCYQQLSVTEGSVR